MEVRRFHILVALLAVVLAAYVIGMLSENQQGERSRDYFETAVAKDLAQSHELRVFDNLGVEKLRLNNRKDVDSFVAMIDLSFIGSGASYSGVPGDVTRRPGFLLQFHWGGYPTNFWLSVDGVLSFERNLTTTYSTRNERLLAYLQSRMGGRQFSILDKVAHESFSRMVEEIGSQLTVPGLAITLVPVSEGQFVMGTLQLMDDGLHRKPMAKVVKITSGFWMSAYEITQHQWDAVMGTNHKSVRQDWTATPAANVSWDDAMEFCRRLTASERGAGRLPVGYYYTLPTEAQWEYACRGSADDSIENGDSLLAHGYFAENSQGRAHEIGERAKNSLGLYDMHGNVWEWCLDWDGKESTLSSADPIGPANGSKRVIRGGSWVNPAWWCLADDRSSEDPRLRSTCIGFRIVLLRRQHL